MDISIEDKIRGIVTPILKRGRVDDLVHTMQVVDIGRYLLKHEKGDEEIVILTAYLHDLGWSTVDTSHFYKHNTELKMQTDQVDKTLLRHMMNGARMAREILSGLDYSADKIDRISSIISVHDDIKSLLALNDASANLVHDADCLDRFRPDRFHKIVSGNGEKMTDEDYNKKKLRLIKHGCEKWFITVTAKRLAEELGDSIIKGDY